MKKITLILFPILFFTNFIMAQQLIYKNIPDPKHNNIDMLVGQLQFKNIAEDVNCNWFNKGADAYKPDSNTIKEFNKKELLGYNFVVFAGTWCEDTQNLLPQFYKTILQLNYPIAQIELYGVDRNKQALNIEHLLYKIEKVPTIILIKNHREVARIVETVSDNIESTLLRIIQKDITNFKE